MGKLGLGEAVIIGDSKWAVGGECLELREEKFNV